MPALIKIYREQSTVDHILLDQNWESFESIILNPDVLNFEVVSTDKKMEGKIQGLKQQKKKYETIDYPEIIKWFTENYHERQQEKFGIKNGKIDYRQIWKVRELYRLLENYYTPLPEFIKNVIPQNIIFSTFPHMPEKDKNKTGDQIVITENENKGRLNIQSPIKIGKFLKQFCDLDDDQIKNLVDEFKTVTGMQDLKMDITIDRIKINEIYNIRNMQAEDSKYESCMSNGKFKNWPDHPAEVYATEDTGVLYFTD